MYKMQFEKIAIRKEIIWKYFLALVICFACALLAVLLSQNEVYQDDWYIEASIDGFFGKNNRSLWVLGPNFIITSIIYLLSLTGIRLFWLHVMLIFMNFVSHILVSIVLINNFGKYIGSLFAVMYGLIMAPLASFEFQFTTTAAYVIAAGCVYMFDALSRDHGAGAIAFSAIWIILGSCLRFDCIYYSVAFMGLIWVFQVVSYIMRNRFKLNKKRLRRCISRRLFPFLITLMICLGLEVSQRVLMNHFNPGFINWNSVRTLVDDYEIPDYWLNEEQYKNIGISYNDYQLLQSWNNLDPDFFTQEKYEQIIKIANENQTVETAGGNGLKMCVGFIVNTIAAMSKNVAFWFAVIILVLMLFLEKGPIWGTGLILFGGTVAFSMYFINIGRFIWRTEWPIWIAFFAALIALLCDASKLKDYRNISTKRKVGLLIIACALFFIPFGNSTSLYIKYLNRYNNPNNIGRYIYFKLVKGETPNYVTYNRGVGDYMAGNKELFYYPLWSYNWLQQYPIYVKDTFRFEEIGAGENWGTLGQYMINLGPIQKNFEKYGIENPFRDLVKSNVRIAARLEENHDRAKELYIYLQEHYYPNVGYSVEEVAGDVVISRFVDELEVSDETVVGGEINVEYGYSSSLSGIAKLNIRSNTVPIYRADTDDAYLRLEDCRGGSYVFSLLKNDSSQVLFFDDILVAGEEYSVDFIFMHENKWYISENCATLNMPTVLEEISLTKFDLLSV